MSRTRIIILLMALGAAVAAALTARGYLGTPPAQTEVVQVNTVKTTEVLVAQKDVKMGERLAGGALAWVSWPEANVSETMITKQEKPEGLAEYEKARARLTIYTGEVLVDKKVVMPGDNGFMAAILPKGKRAISVAISERSSAGGFILPNDRVDVILTKKGTGDNQTVSSETVLTNVRVLAINQNYQQEQVDDTISVAEGKTATLELDARQSEVIAQVESTGELALALRSIAENDGAPAATASEPVLAEKYVGGGTTGTSQTLFVRYGRETYASNP